MPRPPTPDSPLGREDAIVVLGCRVRDGRPSRALERRLLRASELHAKKPQLPVIMSGGKAWEGHIESAVMKAWWQQKGQDTALVSEESKSLTTHENALYVAELCAQLGYRHLALVTCDFHMKRAQKLFQRQDLTITPIPAPSGHTGVARLRLAVREWGASWLGEVHRWMR